MANVPISQLNPGGPVEDTDLFPDVQTIGIGPVKVTGAQIKLYTSTSPTLVTPDIGVAHGTSLALGGATIGSNALAVTGTADFNNAVTFGTQQSIQGQLILSNTAAGAFPVNIKSSNSTSVAWSLTLPTNAGTDKYALTTDGSGVSSWSQIDLSAAVTGTLPVNHGGTGQTTLAAHGVVIGNAASGVNVTATGLAGQIFQSSGALADPVWTTATFPSTATSTGTILRADGTNWVATTSTYPATTSINEILYSSANNQVTGLTTGNGGVLNTSSSGVPSITANPTFGVQQTTQGSLILANTAAGAFSTTIKSSNSASEAWTLTLPISKGTNGYILTTDGTGVSSWTNPTALGIDIDVNSTAITGGTSGRLVYDNAGTFGEISSITTNGSDALTIGTQQTTQGSLVLANTAAGAFSTTLKASNSASSAWTLTLPTTSGTSGYALTTDGSGVTSWNILTVAGGGTGITSGTSGGIPYYSSTSTIASSAALTANAVVIGGGAGVAPSTTTTGTGVITAIGNNTNTAGGLVVPSAALGSGQVVLGGGSGTGPSTSANFTADSSGNVTATRGFLASGSAGVFTGSFTDGLVIDYSSPTARFSAGASDGFGWYNGGIGTTTLMTLSNGSALTLGVQQTTQGSIILANTAAGAFSTTLKSSNSASAAWTLTLPTTAGTNNYWLKTDGSGNTSWTNSIAIATGTSLALGGATIGTDALAITGTSTMGSATYFPDGTAAAPSLAHSGDTNCGIFFPSADTIAFSTSGSEKARFTSIGQFGIGGTPGSDTSFLINNNITGAVTSYGSRSLSTIQNDVTTTAHVYISNPSTADSNFSISGSVSHFSAFQGTYSNITAGGTIANQIGFNASSSLVGATNNFGFYGNIASGSNRWNFYAEGTADNYFAGNVGIGTNVPSAKLAISVAPTSSWASDFSGCSVSIANGSNASLTAGSGMILLTDTSSTGATGLYICGGNSVIFIATTTAGAAFVTPTTTPAAGKACVAYDGAGAYRIYNNIGSTVVFQVATFRTRSAN